MNHIFKSANPFRNKPISQRIVGFINHLRQNNFQVGPKEVLDCLQILKNIGPCPASRALEVLRPVLTGSQNDWEKFETHFEAYWFQRGRVRSRVKKVNEVDSIPNSSSPLWTEHLKQPVKSRTAGQETRVAANTQSKDRMDINRTASEQEAVFKTDLRSFITPEEIEQAGMIAYKLARAIKFKLSRRYGIKKTGKLINLRRTIRSSISKGGTPINLIYKIRHVEPVRIIALLDVSGSMKSYSRVYLQFVKGLVGTWLDVDAYLFHTKLLRITEALREHDPFKSMTRLSLLANGFGGGTKLAECLRTFNDFYAKRTINSRSVLIILSDGYDTDEPEHLISAIACLKKRIRRLIWLNPMLGWKDYEPVTRSMSAVLPFVDCFAEANTLEDLAAIEPELANL